MKNLLQKLIMIGILTFTIFMSAGVLTMHNMGTTDCPFTMGEHALCDMDFTAHMTLWKQSATVNIDGMMTLLMGIVLVITATPRIPTALKIQIKKLKEKNRMLQSNNFLQKLLAQGILHPKIYES